MFELDMLHIPGFIVITSSHEAVTTPQQINRQKSRQQRSCWHRYRLPTSEDLKIEDLNFEHARFAKRFAVAAVHMTFLVVPALHRTTGPVNA